MSEYSEYLDKCLALSPEQRFQAMSDLTEFVFKAMPQESRDNWDYLKQKGF